jgi:hypothetical protein
MKLIRPILIVFLLLAVLPSCQKDKTLYTGTVKVTFTNQPTDLKVFVSSVENPNVSIEELSDRNGTFQGNLNAGNYILKAESTTFFPNVGFQIKAGQTAVIYYGADNNGHVQ